MDNLLRLLTAVMVANKGALAGKPEALLTQSVKLQTTLNIELKWSEAKILMWYELNKDTVKNEALGPYLKTWLHEVVNSLAHFENKVAILEAMRKIAVADNQMHVSERALIILTARQWGLYL